MAPLLPDPDPAPAPAADASTPSVAGGWTPAASAAPAEEGGDGVCTGVAGDCATRANSRRNVACWQHNGKDTNEPRYAIQTGDIDCSAARTAPGGRPGTSSAATVRHQRVRLTTWNTLNTHIYTRTQLLANAKEDTHCATQQNTETPHFLTIAPPGAIPGGAQFPAGVSGVAGVRGGGCAGVYGNCEAMAVTCAASRVNRTPLVLKNWENAC